MTDENSDSKNEDASKTTEDIKEAPAEGDVLDTEATPEDVAPPAEDVPPPVPRLSVTFPFAVVLLQLVVSLYFLNSSTTPMRTYIGIAGAPILATTLLLGWWLLSFSIPLRDRLVGVLLAAAAIAIPLVTATPISPFFLVYLLPVMTTAVVLMAVMTRGMRWEQQRKGLIGALGIFVVFFCMTRVGGVDGNMVPALAWRWDGAESIALGENQVATLPKEAAPGDWPGFRGKERVARNNVDSFAINWDVNPPKELWRQPVGPGWSSFAVVGEYCFTQEQRDDLEAVVCYEVATGKQVWANTVDVHFVHASMGDGPRATPTFHKGMLYTQGATGILQRINASTGETVWQRDIKADSEGRIPTWGYSSSPLITGELLVAYTGAGNGKSIIAYKQETGEIVWTGGKGKNGYSSPQLGEIAAVPQILMSSNYGIETFDPKTGTPLWDQEWNIKSNPRVAQPFVMDLYQVIAGTGQGKGARLIKADIDTADKTWTVTTKWTSDDFNPYFNDFVYYYGYCYGFNGDQLACMDTTDGKVRWTGDKVGGQILFLFDMEMLLVLTESGEILLIPAFPEEGNIVARMPALTGKTWNHPVVSGGKLFVRNSTEAVCYELPPAPPKEGDDEKPAAH